MDLALDNVIRFEETQKLVIDEFDEMLNLGFRTQLTALLAMMKIKRQNILFSATMTDEVDAILNDYFDYPEEIRRMIYTTNSVEALHRQYRKVTKTKGSFPTDDALKKMLYLATLDLKKSFRHKRDWPEMLAALKIVFGERLQSV